MPVLRGSLVPTGIEIGSLVFKYRVMNGPTDGLRTLSRRLPVWRCRRITIEYYATSVAR